MTNLFHCFQTSEDTINYMFYYQNVLIRKVGFMKDLDQV
jgi:hypothetical protein